MLLAFVLISGPSFVTAAETFDRPDDQQIVGKAVSFTDDAMNVMVTGPLIDVRRGPGKGYPIIDTLERGDFIELHRQYTNWVEITGKDGSKGWIHADEYQRLIDTNGRKLTSSTNRQLKSGSFAAQIAIGSVDGGKQIQGGLGYYVSEQIRIDALFGHISEDFLQGRQVFGQITADFKSYHAWTPFMHMGYGVFDSDGFIEGQSQFDAFKFGLGVRRDIFEDVQATFELGRDLILTAGPGNIHADTVRLGFITFF